MDAHCSTSPASSHPLPVGRFVASQSLLLLLGSPILGAAVARAAVWAQHFRAPLVVFPLLVGIGLGLLLLAVLRVGQVGHRPTICCGAILAVAVTVVGQHYLAFLDSKAALIAAKPAILPIEEFQEIMPDASSGFSHFMVRQAALGRPLTAEFSLRGAAAWASWAFDGLLTLLATATIIYLACRTPYCSVCRSWYHTTRAGRLGADQVRRLVDAASLPVEEPLAIAQYRLSNCMSGCGPSRLQLACRGHQQAEVVEAWLSIAQREQVVRLLDDVSREEAQPFRGCGMS